MGKNALNPLVDREARHLNYLRISITDRCNLRCLYCVPEGRIPKLDHADILSYEEILRLVKIGITLGIRKVRITGGEPLVRKGAVAFLARLKQIRELEDVSLTTNGILLKTCARHVFDAGIRRINVSLDTLDRKKYAHITGYDQFDRVWEGIQSALDIGFSPIKINVVAMRGINDDEILQFAELARTYPFHVRFIEYMPIGNSRTTTRDQLLTPEIQSRISSLGTLTPLKPEHHDGPARRFKLSGAVGEIGFISALSHHFCQRCNRLRLTADGKLRACLLSDHHNDLRVALRNGASDETLADIFRLSVKKKAARHSLNSPCKTGINSQMQGIGG
ncbi:MAG: GTP 3',8-cyclase MoaA [Deltaproteobacteria bacterium]|nr:MAG: GTP 3',8-cyclase MoaA [Deltaproteobacteria bacterium]